MIPPYEPEVAAHSFSRGVFCRAKMIENGVTRPVTKTDAFFPSLQLLLGILTEPLAIGDRLYGSGRHGKWKARRLERQAAEQDQLSDHQLRENREFVDNRPELAICKTPEDVALYYAVCEKWATVDMRAAHESNYAEEPKNESCIRKVGRVAGTGWQQNNPWAGKVWCAKHGLEADGSVKHHHVLRRVPKRGEWCCSFAYDAGDAGQMCAYWSDEDRLGRILDCHLYRYLQGLLQYENGVLDNVIAERRAMQSRLENLREEITRLGSDITRLTRQQDALERRLDGMDAGFVASQVDKFFAENLRPVMGLLAEREKELRAAEADGQMEMSEQSEAEIKRDLQAAVFQGKDLSADKKRELVHTFVDSIEVFAPGFTGECLIYFNWSPALMGIEGERVTDSLLAHKPLSNRKREWTAEEDEAVRALFPLASGASYADILAHMQPGRKIDVIARRAWELGIRRPNRSHGWIEECREADKTWWHRNPDVLYLAVEGKRVIPGQMGRYMAEIIKIGQHGLGHCMSLPEEILTRLNIYARSEYP